MLTAELLSPCPKQRTTPIRFQNCWCGSLFDTLERTDKNASLWFCRRNVRFPAAENGQSHAARYDLRESVSIAFLLALEALTPAPICRTCSFFASASTGRNSWKRSLQSGVPIRTRT